MVTTQTHRDTVADTMVAGILAMAAVDLDTLRRVVHPDAINREAVAEPPAAGDADPRRSSRPRTG